MTELQRGAVNVQTELMRINQMMAMSQFDLAESHARSLQQAIPQNTQANLVLAQILAALHKDAAALPFAEKALQLSPNRPGTNYFLGMLYITLKQYEKAQSLLETGISMAPQSAQMQWAMAEMYIALNQGKLAVDHYSRALALPLDDASKQHLNAQYAMALASVGKHSEAEEIFLRLRHDPNFVGQAMLHLAENPKYKLNSPLTKEIRSLIAQSPLDNNTLSKLYLALGRLHERSEDFDEAFRNWVQSRSIVKKNFDVISYETSIDQLIEFYSCSNIQSATQFGDQSTLPIFVFGLPRSGTTLAEQILSAHPTVAGVGEPSRMDSHEVQYFGKYADAAFVLPEDKRANIKTAVANYLNLLSAMSGGNFAHVVDKTLTSYFSAGFIHMCLPNAKFINCIRHPADSFISTFQNALDAPENFDQSHYARFYFGKEKLVEHWRSCFPHQVFDLHYEELVSNPEFVTRKLLSFLNLDWHDDCLNFSKKGSTVRTLSMHQVREPVYTSSVRRWKNYEKHLDPLFAELRKHNFTYPEF